MKGTDADMTEVRGPDLDACRALALDAHRHNIFPKNFLPPEICFQARGSMSDLVSDHAIMTQACITKRDDVKTI